MPWFLRFAAVFLFTSLATAAPIDPRKVGAELTSMFYEGRIDEVWARMDEKMRAALGSKEALAAFRVQVAEQLGNESVVVEETLASEQGYSLYLRRARFEKYGGVVAVQWALAADGTVAGFYIRPDEAPAAAPSKHLDYQTKTKLRLPFDDEIFVFWGGRSVEQNYHAIDANQRFAYDLLMMKDDASHAGEGRRNEDYFCFGKSVLAPGEGTVVEVIDGVHDNVPGQMNPEQVTGNRVVIDHGNGEHSLLAHFRNGSLKMKKGDRVRAGQTLGECGNSGNSSEPHLHYQLQDGPRFGVSAGLPPQFNDYLADGKPVARGEPVKGQRVQHRRDR